MTSPKPALAFASLLLLMVAATQGRADSLADPAAINARTDACLHSADMSQTCIGQVALRCSAEDQGAANPVQQMAWCAGAEQDVWKERMKSDIAAITKLLPKGPALRAFMAQQRLWQAYAHDAFPYDHVDAAFPWAYWGQLGRLSVVATRALQVRDIRMMIEECFAQDSDLRPQPPCDEISGKP